MWVNIILVIMVTILFFITLFFIYRKNTKSIPYIGFLFVIIIMMAAYFHGFSPRF